MPLLTVDRSETLLEHAGADLGTVRHRDEDEVPLVALHVLQVLYEKFLALGRNLFAILVDQHVIHGQAVQFLLDQFHLLNVQRHDTERWYLILIKGRMVPHEGYGLLRDAARLIRIAPGLERPLHPDEIDRKRGRFRRRESDQLATIELLVGKTDQALAPAPVVPP